MDSVDLVERIVAEEGIECHFRRCGHLSLAGKPAHFEHFERSAALLERKFSCATRLVSRAELRTEIGSDAYYGGMVDELSAGINPAQYVAGLARAARAAGATLHEHSCVERVTRQGSGWQVSTTPGRARCG